MLAGFFCLLFTRSLVPSHSRLDQRLVHSHELNWTDPQKPSYMTSALVTHVSVTTTWLAAAKLGRLVLSQVVCGEQTLRLQRFSWQKSLEIVGILRITRVMPFLSHCCTDGGGKSAVEDIIKSNHVSKTRVTLALWWSDLLFQLGCWTPD